MISLSLVKKHLYVELDETEQDDLIQAYIDAALSSFETWTNRTLYEPEADLTEAPDNAIVMSKSIQQGALLLIGHFYANRESVVIGSITSDLPMATKALWMPHRWVNV